MISISKYLSDIFGGVSVFKSRVAVLSLVGTMLAFYFYSCLVASEGSVSKITVENYSDAEVVRYPVVLLRGRVEGGRNETVVVENFSSSLPSRIVKTEMFGGRFKALMELTEGANHLSVASGVARMDITLIYRKSTNKHFVRLISFSDLTDTGKNTDIPVEWLKGRRSSFPSELNLEGRLRTAALLWQTATAERLYDAGYGRRTFTLETDSEGRVVVWKQRGKKTCEEYCAKSEAERFREIYNEILSGATYDKNACFFVLIAFGEKNEVLEQNRGRMALGADNFAMIDSTAFFSCPQDISEASDFFLDSTEVSNLWAHDSAYRNVRWALTASTLGAGLHELGHAFGLGHLNDPNDFMSRGFDRFNRIFTLVEPASALSQGGEFEDEDVVEWTSLTAPKLIRSPWIE